MVADDGYNCAGEGRLYSTWAAAAPAEYNIIIKAQTTTRETRDSHYIPTIIIIIKCNYCYHKTRMEISLNHHHHELPPLQYAMQHALAIQKNTAIFVCPSSHTTTRISLQLYLSRVDCHSLRFSHMLHLEYVQEFPHADKLCNYYLNLLFIDLLNLRIINQSTSSLSSMSASVVSKVSLEASLSISLLIRWLKLKY